MTYTDTSDLTDAEIEAAATFTKYSFEASDIRNRVGFAPICLAIITLARANKRIAAIQAEFDAYRKDVAEAVKWPIDVREWKNHFARFAEPEPDLLAEVLEQAIHDHPEGRWVHHIRQAAASKGYVIEVRKADHD